MTPLIIDNFAGGGGASKGIENALGRPVDVAINHDAVAIAMHKANHPQTRHLNEDVWKVRPEEVCKGRPVGLAWFSPDCTHFSKAKGGKPVKKEIRGLAWVVLKWAKTVKPQVIMLENVEEFTTWGPLIQKENGDHHPCPDRKGETFDAFIRALKRQGYAVEWRTLRACDYGAPTIRKRLFMVARSDGQPIVWPEPTHGDPKSDEVGAGKLKPWRTAAECIDFDLPTPSIFSTAKEVKDMYGLNVRRPLAEATMRRIARGIKKYVLDAAEPFIVPIAHYNGRDTVHDINDSLRTVTASPKGGAFSLISPTLIQTGYGEREGQKPRVPGLDKPLGTAVAGGGKHALCTAFLAKHYGGVVGTGVNQPMGTVTCVDHHSVVAAHMINNMGQSVGSNLDDAARTVTGKEKVGLITSNMLKLRGTNIGHATDEPMHTVTSGGFHLGEVRAVLMEVPEGLTDEQRYNAWNIVRFLEHHGSLSENQCAIPQPRPCVLLLGEFILVDIGMRMLTPRELFRAQGFSDDYIIDVGLDPRELYSGKPLTKTQQVALCGNSVCPPVAEALVRANMAEAAVEGQEYREIPSGF